MIARMRALLLVLAILTVTAAGQDRDAGPPQKQTTGTLTGRVVTAETGRPIALATVTAIRANDQSSAGTVTTDQTGRFRIAALPAGAYVINADKRGAFVSGRYGQSDPTLPGQLVRVEPDNEQAIEIALVRGAVIAGRIVDEAGDPLPLATVVVARPPGSKPGLGITGNVWVVNSNRLPGNLVDGSRSDDRGEYRVFGLAPGEYILYAMPMTPPKDARPVPIYFPGVTDPAQAMRLTVVAGQELGDISFTVRKIPVVKISGVVTNAETVPQANVALSLHVDEAEGGGAVAHLGNTRADGAFSLDAMPGQYVLRARRPQIPSADATAAQPDLSGSYPLWIGESDITGLFLKLTQGATLKGRFIFEGSGSPSRLDRFNVTVESGAPGAIAASRAGQDGSFVLRGIEAGRRRLVASTESGWFVKSVILDGHDVTDLPIEFRDESTISGLAITVTNTPAPLTVEIESSPKKASVTVAVFRADPGRWHARALTATAVGDSGTSVTVDTLPPGDYLAVALDNIAVRTLDLRDNALLEKLKPLAREVRLIEGSPATLRLKPVTLPR
jgi:Carboxypeptidase regulatory-like domain